MPAIPITWTTEMDTALRDLAAAHTPMRHVATLIGVGYGNLRKRYLALGVPTNSRRHSQYRLHALLAQNTRTNDIVKLTGYSRSNVKRARSRIV